MKQSYNEKGFSFSNVQQGTNIQERLLNKPYVNEVTLRGQKPTLKCLSPMIFYIHFGTNIQERLLNKPYVNEVTLRRQNPPLK